MYILTIWFTLYCVNRSRVHQIETPKVKEAIFEIKGKIVDFRSEFVGGAVGALDLREMSMIQMLPNNSGTWTQISESSIEHVCKNNITSDRINPKTCSDFWQICARIMSTKLTLAHHLRVCGDDNLAGQVYLEQLLRAGQGWARRWQLLLFKLG